LWTQGLDKHWGNGTVHLEKLKYAKSAGRYLMKSIGYLAKGTTGNQGSVVGQRYGVSRDLNPKEEIDYIHVGIEGIIAYRKMITESCGEKLNDLYIHEYGIWAPPGFGYDQLRAWTCGQLLI